MSKIVLTSTGTDKKVVLDWDTLVRFIDTARAAAEGHIDSIEALPHGAKYVAEMLAPMVGKEER